MNWVNGVCVYRAWTYVCFVHNGKKWVDLLWLVYIFTLYKAHINIDFNASTESCTMYVKDQTIIIMMNRKRNSIKVIPTIGSNAISSTNATTNWSTRVLKNNKICSTWNNWELNYRKYQQFTIGNKKGGKKRTASTKISKVILVTICYGCDCRFNLPYWSVTVSFALANMPGIPSISHRSNWAI